MPALTTFIAVAGLAVAGAGAYTSFTQAKEAASAQRKMNELNKRKADLEANRKKREWLRGSWIERASQLSRGTNQGAGGSSGLSGAIASTMGIGWSNLLGVNQGQEIGAQMTEANNQYSSAASMASMGSGLTSLGGSIVSSRGEISRTIQSL